MNQHHAGLIPDQKLDPVCPFRTEHEDSPQNGSRPNIS
ncbi:hypothetical protein AKL17_3p0080 (plasmid) [Frigidibacter mobilis]|uniref:Uncharacterized protein n=1 Tax=Frigidibacter mobilis TaxID=1335048 RepID=A0A159Z9H3_9RHOB|nr:hypothetical protein AKL17_3p0080 [Frigidibacter mobilis]